MDQSRVGRALAGALAITGVSASAAYMVVNSQAFNSTTILTVWTIVALIDALIAWTAFRNA